MPQEIERIKSLDLPGVGLEWQNVFGKRAPAGLPKALLVRVLVYRIQADALGDLDPWLVQLLESYSTNGGGKTTEHSPIARGRALSEVLTIKPGSVLIRDWGGRTHRVMVLEIGFAWEGKNYQSLSEVARAITGTRWNGRRFFGVDQKAGRSRSGTEKRCGSAPENNLVTEGGE